MAAVHLAPNHGAVDARFLAWLTGALKCNIIAYISGNEMCISGFI